MRAVGYDFRVVVLTEEAMPACLPFSLSAILILNKLIIYSFYFSLNHSLIFLTKVKINKYDFNLFIFIIVSKNFLNF